LTVFLTVFLGMHTSRDQKPSDGADSADGLFHRLVLENALERVIRSLFGTLFTTEGANRGAGFREEEKLTNLRYNGY